MILNHIILLLTFSLNGPRSIETSASLNLKDTLSSRSVEYLSRAAQQNTNDSLKSTIYLDAWLKKAKEESNNIQIAQAYRVYSYKVAAADRTTYADSMLFYANKTFDKLLIGTAYLTKGIAYYNKRDLRKALDNYLQADKYVSMTKDQDTKFMIKYTLGLTKYQIGFYDEAISLFEECLTYYEQENDRAYINTLHALALCHNKAKNHKIASDINALGIKECKELSDPSMIPYFNNAEGINQFSLGNYTIALELLLNSLPHIEKKNDFPNQAITSYYIGKALWQLNQKQKAIIHLKIVDEIFQNKNYIRRDLRETYELLIDYYKDKKELDEVLTYVNTLLKVDRELIEDQYYLVPKVIKEYDTAKLLEVKSQTEKQLQEENTSKSFLIAALSISALIILFSSYTIKKKYKTKFLELMAHDKLLPQKVKREKKDKDAILDISPKIVTTVMNNMKIFEMNKTYLESDLTQVKLADILETNTSYIPKIVFYATGKTTIDYLCDLKIDYIVANLKNESRIKNYTLKGLGEEAGFGSTQSFTRAFKSRTGLGPVFFISQLKKSQNK